MNNKEKLIDMGIDYDEVMIRFAFQEQLYMKFLNKFSQDSNYLSLMSAYENQDNKTMETAAHTLKGVSANLGLRELSHACEVIVLDIRENKERSVLSTDLKKVQTIYERIIFQMKTIEGE